MHASSVDGLQAFVTDPDTGTHYKEYAIPEDEIASTAEDHAVKYIEIVEGQKFYVTLDIGQAYPFIADDVRYLLAVDGKRLRGKHGRLKGYCRSYTFRGHEHPEGGRVCVQGMAFAPLKTNEGAATLEHLSSTNSLGLITLEVFRCRLGPSRTTTRDKPPLQLDNHSELPEKALKGRSLSNSVSLTAAEKTTRKYTWSRVSYPWGTKPIAIFTFRYRSQRDLKAEGIIPRTPTPEPLEAKDPKTLTQEELLELVLRQRTLLKEKDAAKKELEVKIKRERVEPENADDGEVEVLRSKRARRTLPENVVDLSED